MSDITTVHSDIIQSHILTRLDGPALASAASATAHLRRLCTEHHLWRNICAANWPSLTDPFAAALVAAFPAGHRSLFSDAFPALQHTPNPIPEPAPVPPEELLSAVDILYKGKSVLSRTLRTETRKGWFLCSPLWVDLLDPNEVVPTALVFTQNDESQWLSHLHQHLSLSWIMIHPTRHRAANLSSRRAVGARRHWLTGELEILYALPMDDVQCVIKVTCCGKVGGAVHVREVSLTMEDIEGRHVMGREGLVILQDAMETGKRVKPDAEEAVRRFDKFCSLRRERKERRMKRDKAMDLLAMLVAFSVFATLFCFMAFSA
uniref:F-box protein At2g27310 family n=2 Tax=Cajanus cajan TaxID=3821 RepID=A0A151R2G5_CAJCA|nr:F-box protein At2g27310 family [Cajanus cajan]